MKRQIVIDRKELYSELSMFYSSFLETMSDKYDNLREMEQIPKEHITDIICISWMKWIGEVYEKEKMDF